MTITINNKAHTVLKFERHKLDNNGVIYDYYISGFDHPVCLTDLFVRAKHFVTIKHFYGDYCRATRILVASILASVILYSLMQQHHLGEVLTYIQESIVSPEILIP